MARAPRAPHAPHALGWADSSLLGAPRNGLTDLALEVIGFGNIMGGLAGPFYLVRVARIVGRAGPAQERALI